LFISDVHLGSPGCQAEALLAFLKAHTCQRLYLVGDIVDGWQLRKRWFWPEAHNRVIQKLLRLARKGCHITFVPGNHDEFARAFAGHHFGGIEVAHEALHTTTTGQRLWVIHGDAFDGVIQCAKWLAHLGDTLYEWTLRINRHYNQWRTRMGQPYWSLSAYLKFKVKKAVMYVNDFEQALAREALRRGYDGVVCGHIHRATLVQTQGVIYANCGDWVESCSALAENAEGHLVLLHWHDSPRAAASRVVTAQGLECHQTAAMAES
ncbi:UDP-2,3-diacylglucosamine diphosphatase, partial [Rhodoferax sp.]|uniref:UDP-2,3-diacylglucosamine diphosphatase n=1 Tax=Rhodoferax sp. TaxID=50421 RepID=UPI00261CAA4F